MLYATFKTQVIVDEQAAFALAFLMGCVWLTSRQSPQMPLQSQVLNENARKPLSIGYLAFSLCSDILAALSVF